MKRKGNLYPNVWAFANLLAAYKRAKRGTKSNAENRRFLFFLETELLQLQRELKSQTYQPQGYRYFTIQDPKQRLISVAAFRDRIVHHALVAVLEPIYEPIFIADSYATRKLKGTHRAIKKAQIYLRQNHYYYKADIKKYFDNIDQPLLLALVARKIKDPAVLDLTRKIICNGGSQDKGLPIGNLTSQFFANIYLNELDYFVKRHLQVKHYIRYMDDFVIFHTDKQMLKSIVSQVTAFLAETLFLQINDSYTFFNTCSQELRFLGANIMNVTIRIKRETLRRIMQKIKRNEYLWAFGQIEETKFQASMSSLWAFLSAFDTEELKRTILQQGNRL